MVEILKAPSFLQGKEALITSFDDSDSYLPDAERDPKFNHDYLRAFLEALMRIRVITPEQAIALLDDAINAFAGQFIIQRSEHKERSVAVTTSGLIKPLMRQHDIEGEFEIEHVRLGHSENLAHEMRGALRKLHSVVVGNDTSALLVPRFGSTKRTVEIVDPFVNPLIHGRIQYPLGVLAKDVVASKGHAFIVK